MMPLVRPEPTNRLCRDWTTGDPAVAAAVRDRMQRSHGRGPGQERREAKGRGSGCEAACEPCHSAAPTSLTDRVHAAR